MALIFKYCCKKVRNFRWLERGVRTKKSISLKKIVIVDGTPSACWWQHCSQMFHFELVEKNDLSFVLVECVHLTLCLCLIIVWVGSILG